jgi:hypothetical protein
MMRRTTIGAAAVTLVLVAGCGSQPGVGAPPTASTPAPAEPLVLVQLHRGVGAVPVGSDDPRWADPSAVAALDGSAVFSIRRSAGADELARLDPDTGDAITAWPLPSTMESISAVSPGGRWVALTDGPAAYTPGAPRPATRLVVFDTDTGSESRRLELRGDVRPEAFSVTGELVFALDYRGDSYRVQTVYLETGEQYDTSSRDKSVEREDMYGTSVRAVLSADKTLLSTLYRNPDPDEPAFVHILDLQNGWAYCADLTAPFGTGPEGSDRIEITPAGTVVVAATQVNRIAEIHIEEVHQPSDQPVTVEYRDGALPPTEPAFDASTGFAQVIATLR